MAGFPTSLGGGGDGDGFGSYGEFDPETAPVPGSFLDGHDVLAGTDHLAFHRLTRAIFEERGVYDMTFGYNLARLNLDGRHPRAGYRYAVEDPGADDALSADLDVLRAEFTPTTPFCPQSDTLTKGSFRAWNGLRDRHEYDVVRVRVDGMHQQADAINDALADLEAHFLDTGDVERLRDRVGSGTDGAPGRGGERNETGPGASRGYDSPF